MLISENATLSLQKDGKVLDACVSHAEVINKHCVYAAALCRELTETGRCGAISIIYRRLGEFKRLEVAVTKLLRKLKAELGLDPKFLNIPSFEKPTFRRKTTKFSLEFMRSLDDYLKFVIKLPSEIFCHPEVNHFFHVRTEDMTNLIKRKPTDDLHAAFDISNPVSLDCYVVRADFTNPGEGELEIHSGEEVEVIQKSDTGWWFAVSPKGSGWVPSSYLETSITNYPFRPGCEEFHVVTKSYKKTLDDELTVPEGAILQILDRNDSGWWNARFAGKIGLVPGTNLSRVNTVKAKRAIGSLGSTQQKICLNMTREQNISSSPSSSTTSSVSDSSSDLSKLSTSTESLSLRSADALPALPPSPPEDSTSTGSVEDLQSTSWSQHVTVDADVVVSHYELFQTDVSRLQYMQAQQISDERAKKNERKPDQKAKRLPRYAFQNEGFVFSQSSKPSQKIIKTENQNPQLSPLLWRTMVFQGQSTPGISF